MVDAKIFIFTRNMTWLSFVSIMGLSVLLYIAYFFLADLYDGFKIYKSAFNVLSSPSFYLLLLQVLAVTIIVDVFILITVREVKTPLYLMFRSIEESAKPKEEKVKAFSRLASKVKRLIFGKFT